MIVLLKCPTCIYLAILGDEKSTTILCFGTYGKFNPPTNSLILDSTN
jgi:hypothetical protein